MINSLVIFGLSLAVVVGLLVYIHIKVSGFLVGSHRTFATARDTISKVDLQEKDIFHQNEALIEVTRNNINQTAIVKKLLLQIRVFMQDSLKDDKKR